MLEFSCDSVKFDTVFTELGTPTKTFVVYNRHKKQLNISSIRVAGGSKNFRINVDGRSGEVFNDIEVRGQDSIYVFVECYIDANESDKPIEVSDKLEFVTNGVTQKITLNAWGQDVVRLYNERVEHGELRLTAAKPYVIFDSLTVDQGARLVIEPDAKLHFHKGAKLRIDGTLQAQGTQGHEIIMRGDRIDNVVGEYSFELMSGQWWGVVFGPTSEGNEMSYVNMRSSSYGVEVYGTNGENRNLHLFNSILHNSSGDVLRCENAWVEAEGCEFSDAAAVVVRILGGRTQLDNCTLAN